jgi:uracil-DNA glycosylase family 4
MKNSEYDQFDHLFPRRTDLLSLAKGAECHLCKGKGFNFVGKDIVWGNGKHDAEIMAIGMDSAGAKPKERLWKGSRCTLMPLTNKKTGAKFRIFLLKAGINPFLTYITNIVKCSVGRDQLRLDFNELSKVCINYLEQEIATVKPKIMITLGSDVKKELDNIILSKELMGMLGLSPSIIVSKAIPFLAEFKNGIKAKVFNIHHPSRIEGYEKEKLYTKSIELIKNCL